MDKVEAQGRGFLSTRAERMNCALFQDARNFGPRATQKRPVALSNFGSQHQEEVANSKNGIPASLSIVKSFVFSRKDSTFLSNRGNRTAKLSGSYRCAQVLCLSPGY
jgi:hypothetical protein